MIKVIENSEIEDMIFEKNYILIMCKELSSCVIKQLGKRRNEIGIYYMNGFVLDTVNGVLTKINKQQNQKYKLPLYVSQTKMLTGTIDYEMFYDFLNMRKYFLEYYGISLYWDETKDKCIYEKTTFLDKFGGSTLDNAFKPIKQININAKIFSKIKFVPSLKETLDSFVDEFKVGKYFKD